MFVQMKIVILYSSHGVIYKSTNLFVQVITYHFVLFSFFLIFELHIYRLFADFSTIFLIHSFHILAFRTSFIIIVSRVTSGILQQGV